MTPARPPLRTWIGRTAAATTPGSAGDEVDRTAREQDLRRLACRVGASCRSSPSTMEWFSLKLWMSKPIASDATAIAAPLNAG